MDIRLIFASLFDVTPAPERAYAGDTSTVQPVSTACFDRSSLTDLLTGVVPVFTLSMIPRYTLSKGRSLLRSSFLVVLVAATLSQTFAAEPEVVPITSNDQLYALENLLRIEITMAPREWDKLRLSSRGEALEEQDGEWVAMKLDYEYVPGEVTINGVNVGKVGLRKKGFFGSLSTQRPSLKLKFNEYVKGRKFVGQKGLTLNNNLQDPSQLRQYLAYAWFRRAGLHASRCNLARVFVNGRDVGIYSNVESLDEAFLKKNFDDAEGTLFEGTFTDFNTSSVEHFEAKTNKKSPDRSQLREVAELLQNYQSVDMDKLAELVDVDQFMKFWVAEMLLGHWDGYAGSRHNYFVYDNPTSQRLEFLPWDTDGTFDDSKSNVSEPAPRIIRAQGRLCAALYSNSTGRQRYLELVEKQLDEWWNSTELLAELDRAAALIRPHVHLPQSEFDQALTGLRGFIERTPRDVRKELKAAPDRWLTTVPEGRPLNWNPEEPAARLAGSVKSEFLFPFGRFDTSEATVVTNGLFELEWRGKPLEFPVLTGTAGYQDADPPWYESPKLMIAGTSPETGGTVWFWMSLDPDLLKTGGVRWRGTHPRQDRRSPESACGASGDGVLRLAPSHQARCASHRSSHAMFPQKQATRKPG